jgi:membrane associated rhomboid family serine protease
MVFPIGDVNIHRGHKPMISYLFIAINVVVWLYQITLSNAGLNLFYANYASVPMEINQGIDLFTLVTSIFMHGSWMHIIGNMLFLWVFADNIEAIIGSGKFFLFYMVGGIVASLAHYISNPGSSIPTVGASGAISACLGAYLMMFPSSKVKVLVLFLFRTIEVSAIYFLGFWIVQQLFSGVGALAIPKGESEGGGVAYWAHIGGFAFGVALGFVFRKKVAWQATNPI